MTAAALPQPIRRPRATSARPTDGAPSEGASADRRAVQPALRALLRLGDPARPAMPYEQITGVLIPRLAACRVERVTLTGGEPTIHPQFLDVVRAFRGAGMAGRGLHQRHHVRRPADQRPGANRRRALQRVPGRVPAESHGRFRGDRDSFDVTVATVRALAGAGLLQGLLCTPNSLAEDGEYRELCEFAAENGAGYVLMNPLSSMGRGVKARGRLAATRGADAPDLRADCPVRRRWPGHGPHPVPRADASRSRGARPGPSSTSSPRAR